MKTSLMVLVTAGLLARLGALTAGESLPEDREDGGEALVRRLEEVTREQVRATVTDFPVLRGEDDPRDLMASVEGRVLQRALEALARARLGEEDAHEALVAVVADEVKKLANQTAQATEEISSAAEVISNHTRVAGDAIGEISEIIRQIHDIQTTIASGVEEQTATTAEIAHSVAEAATGSSEMAERIAGIAAAVQQTAVASTSSHKGADELAAMAEELEKIVGRFTY